MSHEAWSWKPDVFAGSVLAASMLLYLVGLARMRRRGNPIRIAPLEPMAFATGWLTLAGALLSPLATLAEQLFSVHMTQHELLMLVAAPLIAIGRPLVPMLWALPAPWRRAAGDPRWHSGLTFTTSPLTVFLLHAIALWVWHVPVLYEAAVRSDFIHLLQHLSFAGTAALFWWGLIRGRYGRLGYGAAFIYIFATAVHSGGLGALLAVSNRPWYTWYADRAISGANALEDQQLGGFIMWVPSGIVMMLFGLGMFAAWLGEADRRRRKGWAQ